MELLEALEKSPFMSKLKKLTKKTEGEIKKELIKLIKDNLVINRDNKYYLLEKGVIQAKNDIYGFILPENKDKKDVYVTLDSRLRDKDYVLFYRYKDYTRDYELKEYASVVKVLERSLNYIIGEVKEFAGKFFIETDNYRFQIINKGVNLVPGLIVKTTYPDISSPKVKVLEIIGHTDDPGIEISTIAATYGFELDFNEKVKLELKNIPEELSLEDIKSRHIYDEKIFTIDGDDSKDFDDAVSIKKLDNGNYLLGVYIADVSNYVTFNSELDKEAFKRTTSVYLADRVIPMLPHELSNGICSLNEGVYRFVLSCIMEIDQKGKTINYKIEEGIIKSCHRMTYNKVNLILEGNESLIKEYEDIYESIILMNELHQIIRKRNEEKGSLEFEVDEYKYSLNPDGSPKAIILRERKEAEKIIEDFMIKANETVATHMSNLKLPCLYRVHEAPDQDRLREVLTLIRNMGIDVKIPRNDILPKNLQNALDSIENSPNKYILNNLLLRSMAKAKYQPENLGHYGLALKDYSHFTSPIRRYPDLILHRIIKELIIHPTDYMKCYNFYSNNLDEVGLKTSSGERRAIECERQVNDMLSAWYMETKVNGIFKVMVTSITKFGMFVTTDEGVEGLVHVKNMIGMYDYDETNIRLVSKNRTFNLGDNIEVVLIASDRKTSKIDFMLKEDYIKERGEFNDKNSIN